MANINGNNNDNDLEGTSGADTINGKGGGDEIRGLNGNDTLAGDNFLGPHGDDEIYGGDGKDELYGQGGDDDLYGGKGNDYLAGRDDDDRLAGNLGADELWGGEGADTFAYEKIEDSQAGFPTLDRVRDFDPSEDRFDLSAIDANANQNGNQSFSFGGEGGITDGVAQVKISYYQDDFTFINLSNDDAFGAESVIRLDGIHNLQASDFVL